jgi:UrcA family protein
MMQVRPFILAAAVVAAGLSTLTAVSPAMALESGVAVAHDDLNLRSEAGRAALDRRIERAARSVCGTALNVELDIAANIADCRADVLASARRQVDAIVGSGDYAELRLARSVRTAN